MAKKKEIQITKKKTTKKKTKKRKRRQQAKITTEQLYSLINKVQLNKKEVKFSVDHDATDMVKNILKDVSLKYQIEILATKTKFRVMPNFESPIDDFIESELDDEMFWEFEDDRLDLI